MSTFQYYNWEEVNINWEGVNMNWEEVGFLINDVLPFVGGSGGVSGKHSIKLEPINKLPEDKKRLIIKLVCKIEGKEYEESKYINNKNIKIKAKHIEIILEELFKNNIKVNVQNIS